jgi:hypothetical protein
MVLIYNLFITNDEIARCHLNVARQRFTKGSTDSRQNALHFLRWGTSANGDQVDNEQQQPKFFASYRSPE